jgi:hypothetical protein
MIHVKINGTKHQIKTDWSEVTLKELKQFSEQKNDSIDLIAWALGMTRKEVQSFTDIDGANIVLDAMQFVSKPIGIIEIYRPEKITILRQSVNVPENLNTITIGQYKDIEMCLQEETDIYTQSAKMLAIFLQTHISNNTKEYDYEESKKLIPFVMHLPALQVLAMRSFFLTKLSGSKVGISRIVKIAHILLMKFQQVLWLWRVSAYSIYCRLCAKIGI